MTGIDHFYLRQSQAGPWVANDDGHHQKWGTTQEKCLFFVEKLTVKMGYLNIQWVHDKFDKSWTNLGHGQILDKIWTFTEAGVIA